MSSISSKTPYKQRARNGTPPALGAETSQRFGVGAARAVRTLMDMRPLGRMAARSLRSVDKSTKAAKSRHPGRGKYGFGYEIVWPDHS